MTRRVAWTWMLALAGLAATLVACGEPTPEEVRQRTEPIVIDVLKATQTSLDGAAKLEELQSLLDLFQVVAPDDTIAPEVPPDVPKPDVPAEESVFDAQAAAAEVNDMLAQYVFTAANVESTTSDSITFLIRGSLICEEIMTAGEVCVSTPEGPVQCEPSTPTPEEVKECADQVDQLAIRVKATLVGSDGVDLALQVGPGPAAMTLKLRPNSVTIVPRG